MFRGSVSPKSNFPALLKVALPKKMQTHIRNIAGGIKPCQTIVLLRWLRLHHHWWRFRPLGRCRGRHQRGGQRQACGLLRVLGLVPDSVQQSTCPNSASCVEYKNYNVTGFFRRLWNTMHVSSCSASALRLVNLQILFFPWDRSQRLDPCKLSLANGRPFPASKRYSITILTFYEAATTL